MAACSTSTAQLRDEVTQEEVTGHLAAKAIDGGEVLHLAALESSGMRLRRPANPQVGCKREAIRDLQEPLDLRLLVVQLHGQRSAQPLGPYRQHQVLNEGVYRRATGERGFV